MATAASYPYGFCLFDIDGTLIGTKGVITGRVSAALGAVRAKGGCVIVATGRPPQLAASIPAKVGGQVDYLLCGNGACAFRVAQPGQEATPADEWAEAATSNTIEQGVRGGPCRRPLSSPPLTHASDCPAGAGRAVRLPLQAVLPRARLHGHLRGRSPSLPPA